MRRWWFILPWLPRTRSILDAIVTSRQIVLCA